MKMKWNKQKIKYGLRRLFLLILSAATVCVMALPVLAMTQVEAELPFTVEGACGTVRIEAEDGTPLPEVTEFTGEGTGKFTMQYTEPDDYVYRVYQLPGGETDVTYDETEYRVLVSVIVNDDGNLIPRITLATEGSVQKPAEIAFTNERIQPPTPDTPPEHHPKTPTPHVKTGDYTQLGLYIGLFLVAGLAIFLTLRKRKKGKR